MSTPTFNVLYADYDAAVVWLEEQLNALEMLDKEILRMELFLEENFYRLAASSQERQKFSAKLAVRKRFGEIYLNLAAQGLPNNPLVEMNETSNDEAAMYSLAILKAYRNQMSYSRKQGENIISIRVHSFGDKSIWYTIIALIVGFFIGVLIKFCSDAETLRWIVHNLFDSVEMLFMNALIMVAAPMIFFSVISGIAGMAQSDNPAARL